MPSPRSRRHQGGYLLEAPLILMVVGVALALLLPKVPPWWQKILLGLGAVPVLFALYAMIVAPGWIPGDSRRLRPPWSVLVFLLIAGTIIAGVLLFILAGR